MPLKPVNSWYSPPMFMNKSMLLGAARSIDLIGGLGIARPRGVESDDARAHWNDWKAVGEDLHYAIVSFQPIDSDESAQQLTLFDGDSPDDG